jgi:Ca2+-dependent lipid-binding protein
VLNKINGRPHDRPPSPLTGRKIVWAVGFCGVRKFVAIKKHFVRNATLIVFENKPIFFIMGVLTVKLIKVTNLVDGDGLGKSDPYVKFYLEQDNLVFDKGYGKQESSKKHNQLNPEYNETFEFTDLPSMNNMVLSVKILDADIGLDDKLGSCKVNLEKLKLSETQKEVEEVVDSKRNAKIYLALSYKK